MEAQLKVRKPIAPFGLWMGMLFLSVNSGCSSIVGPHQIKVQLAPGVKVVDVEGYGCNALFQNDTAALHLGWFQRTLVFEQDVDTEERVMEGRFGFFSKLPSGFSYHQSVVDVGACAAWEPTFRGFSFGFQSRSLSRLPIEENLILDSTHGSKDKGIKCFSLHKLP